jgi:hypothetical protein
MGNTSSGRGISMREEPGVERHVFFPPLFVVILSPIFEN